MRVRNFSRSSLKSFLDFEASFFGKGLFFSLIVRMCCSNLPVPAFQINSHIALKFSKLGSIIKLPYARLSKGAVVNYNIKNEFAKFADVTLLPGQVYIVKRYSTPQIIKMVLGSCVSIIFYHKETRAAAISHALLPSIGIEGACDHCILRCSRNKTAGSFRHVSCAVKYMYEQFRVMGIPNSEIIVKVVGGAHVLSSLSVDVGAKNLEKVHEELKDLNLSISSEDIGGTAGRMISFNTENGEVIIRQSDS